MENIFDEKIEKLIKESKERNSKYFEKQKLLKKMMREALEDTRDASERVYFYHSDNPKYAEKGSPFRMQPVTVCGVVDRDKENEGQYTLTIAWSRTHWKDDYNRKLGNFIAMHHATISQCFDFNGIPTCPLFFTGFAHPDLRENFIAIAKMLVSMFEGVYFPESGVFETIDGMGMETLVHLGNVGLPRMGLTYEDVLDEDVLEPVEPGCGCDCDCACCPSFDENVGGCCITNPAEGGADAEEHGPEGSGE